MDFQNPFRPQVEKNPPKFRPAVENEKMIFFQKIKKIFFSLKDMIKRILLMTFSDYLWLSPTRLHSNNVVWLSWGSSKTGETQIPIWLYQNSYQNPCKILARILTKSLPKSSPKSLPKSLPNSLLKSLPKSLPKSLLKMVRKHKNTVFDYKKGSKTKSEKSKIFLDPKLYIETFCTFVKNLIVFAIFWIVGFLVRISP